MKSLIFINLWIDEVYVSVPNTYTILQACSSSGIEVPRFCYHEKLSIAGNCRMCLVEVSNNKKLVAACAVSAADSVKVYTSSLRVKKARESVLEFLLANHPLDCPICDQGGECDLQDITMAFGSDRGRFYELEKRAVEDKYCGPLIKTVMTRCIHCTRCIRFISEFSTHIDFGTTGRGNHMEVGTYILRALTDEISSNIVDLCPVGALTSKPYSFTTRPWELTSVESIDIFDILCSNTKLQVYANKVKRILPRINESLNEDWLTNKIRYIYDSFDTQRLIVPMLNLGWFMFQSVDLGILRRWVSVSWSQILLVTTRTIRFFKLNPVFGPYLDLETFWSFKALFSLFGLFNSFNYFYDYTFLYFSHLRVREVERYSLFLSVNSYLRNEIPLLNTRVRKSYNRCTVAFRFLCVGVGVDRFTYPVDLLSNNTNTFKNLMVGKHYICRSLISFKDKLVIFYNSFGANFFSNVFMSIFKPFLLNVFLCISSLLACHLGFSADFDKSGFIYSVGLDTSKSLKPFVYQGHHGTSLTLDSFVVMPTALFSEKSSTYLNLEGLLQRSHLAVSPDKLVKKDSEVFSVLIEINKLFSKDKLNPFYLGKYNVLNWLNLLLPYWIAGSIIYFFNINRGEFYKNFMFMINVLNYYWDNIFSHNSATMAKCANIIMKKNVSYN